MGRVAEARNNAWITQSRQTQLRDKPMKLNAKTQNAPKWSLGGAGGSGVSVGMGEVPGPGKVGF
ncbi:hypothetical protein TH4_15010 [Thalassospira tepidiphila MCCC 1A03514]|uniref:Uncharacterized protein n=1 Tax=Thalassospira tepidiphila MCCC 1A03514 TaxID=1177930 RepID=A0A853KYG1_9PROT|nr:hypothetical protein TH4_15010 [Thalassospira tepidiphila MCCC 1A03514]